MLLSLINKTTIFLHPEYISAVKHTGILKKHISSKEVITIEKAEDISESAGVIDALRNLLKKPEWKNCNAVIVLSGDFTKLRVVKWNDNLTQKEQKTRTLQELEEIYGVDGKPLHAFISISGFRKNSLAFAIEESFYKALLSIENERLIKLNSILPYFALITNFWRKSINKSAWLIVKESARIYSAKLKEDSWELIKVDTVKSDWEQDIKKMLGREMMQQAIGVDQIYFHEEAQSNINLESIKSIQPNIVVLRLNGFRESNVKLMFSSYLV